MVQTRKIIAETSTTSTSKQIEESSIIHQIKWTSDIEFSTCHPKNSIMAFGSRKHFVLCTNVQTSIIWFLRMCFFVNGLIMLNKHITISRLTISASKQLSKINKNKSSAFQLIIIIIRLSFSTFFLFSQVCF